MKINVFSKRNKSHEADYLPINNELSILKYVSPYFIHGE